jgi:holin-like protein
MDALTGLALLLLCQSAGELLARGLNLPLPGPVLGLLLLWALLAWPWVRKPVAAVAEPLLGHLSLLFVPVGVGVVAHLGLVTQYGGRIVLAVVASTVIGMAVTALVLKALLGSDEALATDERAPSAPPQPDGGHG